MPHNDPFHLRCLQVNERETVDNTDSCDADCQMPFLTCPPFNISLPTCRGLGSCYSSIGACSCFTGYMGDDCSSCASGYRQVRNSCVAMSYLTASIAKACTGTGCGRGARANPALTVGYLYDGPGPSAAMLGVVLAGGVSGGVVLLLGVVLYRLRQQAALEHYKEYLKYEATRQS
jgi:hypothetical protein